MSEHCDNPDCGAFTGQIELDQARDTIRRLNRRCQVAESALAERLKSDPHGTSSKSFGRRFVGAAASRFLRERDEARARVAELESLLRVATRSCEEEYLCELGQWPWVKAAHALLAKSPGGSNE